MLNHQRYKNIIEAKRTKARIARLASMAAQSKACSTLHYSGSNYPGWFQQKKRLSQRLRSLSNGHIILADGYPFMGPRARNWVIDTRCEHVFVVAARELLELGLEACPFCNIPEDLKLCGSVEAVQQMVESISYSNIEFLAGNELRGSDDMYEFACLIHKFRFEGSYRSFIHDPVNFCHLCALKNNENIFFPT
jgi:hypothetical protein